MKEKPIYALRIGGKFLGTVPTERAKGLPLLMHACGTEQEAREWVAAMADDHEVPEDAYEIVEFAATGRKIEV